MKAKNEKRELIAAMLYRWRYMIWVISPDYWQHAEPKRKAKCRKMADKILAAL